MVATDDTQARESQVAAAGLPLPRGVAMPSLGAARDGDGYAILMRDIADLLLPEEGITPREQISAIFAAMAGLHAAPIPAGEEIAWCDVGLRLTLLCERRMPLALRYQARVSQDLRAGWPLFHKHTSPAASSLIRALSDDVQPLLQALSRLPASLLHGDLKFDNIGVGPDGTVWLIDWAMPLLAPPAVELGWFIAMNSRRAAVTPDGMLELYAARAGIPHQDRDRHEALTALCGLLLRGWRKGLDAEAGERQELAWWCERAEAARRFL